MLWLFVLRNYLNSSWEKLWLSLTISLIQIFVNHIKSIALAIHKPTYRIFCLNTTKEIFTFLTFTIANSKFSLHSVFRAKVFELQSGTEIVFKGFICLCWQYACTWDPFSTCGFVSLHNMQPTRWSGDAVNYSTDLVEARTTLWKSQF